MSQNSKIGWLGELPGHSPVTINPIFGCSQIAPGCGNCYAMKMASRLEKMSQALEAQGKNPGALKNYEGTTLNGKWTGRITFDPTILDQISHWQKPRLVFLNSMYDLFHEAVEDAWIDLMFDQMEKHPRHKYIILTKRFERMADYFHSRYPRRGLKAPTQIAAGISAGTRARLEIGTNWLRQTPVAVKVVSAEPWFDYIEEATLQEMLVQLDWILIGGESGIKARPCNIESIENFVRACGDMRVPLFVKQLGTNPFHNGLPLNIKGKGEALADLPNPLRVRQYPKLWS